MAHAFGSLEFPFGAPAAGAALTDPALDVIADYLTTLIRAWAGTAYVAAFPGEVVIREILKYDPEEGDFIEIDLPALYVWREKSDGENTADSKATRTTILNVLWVAPPPTRHDDTQNRVAFFNGFEKAVARAVERGRDPAWVVAAEAALPASVIYGSSVRKHAGFSSWRLKGVDRAPLLIQHEGGRPMRYPGVVAQIELTELSKTDVTQFGVVPFGTTSPAQSQLDFRLTTGGVSPLDLQHEREPDT